MDFTTWHNPATRAESRAENNPRGYDQTKKGQNDTKNVFLETLILFIPSPASLSVCLSVCVVTAAPIITSRFLESLHRCSNSNKNFYEQAAPSSVQSVVLQPVCLIETLDQRL